MKIWKILLGIGILFLIIGVVSAADIADTFKAPSGLEKVGTNSFVDRQGHNILISEYTDDNINTWLQNDSDPVYLVQKYNDTCYIATDDENDCYIHEIVEKDGVKYLISSWTPKGPNEAQLLKKNLEEFNKLNNIKPLNVDSVT